MGEFKYTQPSSKLTPEQRRFYEDNGYLLIKNNVDDKLLDEVKQYFTDVCNGVKPGQNILLKVKDPSLKVKPGVRGEYLTNKIQDFLYDDVLWKYCSDKNVVDIVEGILGPNVTVVNSMIINKPPDANPESSLHPLHQDMHYFPVRPADKICASWTAMERADERNGCLYVVPGSHKGELLKHEYPKFQGLKNSLYHGVQGLDHLPTVHVVMEKGDTLFFHPILLHGSGPNYTKGFRKAISCHYASSDCHFVEIRGTIQENLVTEVEDLVKRKGGVVKYEDFWKLKSRLVRGIPGEFQKMDSHL